MKINEVDLRNALRFMNVQSRRRWATIHSLSETNECGLLAMPYSFFRFVSPCRIHISDLYWHKNQIVMHLIKVLRFDHRTGGSCFCFVSQFLLLFYLIWMDSEMLFVFTAAIFFFYFYPSRGFGFVRIQRL